MSGTTEKIFESKISLYDVYVDNQVVRGQPGGTYTQSGAERITEM